MDLRDDLPRIAAATLVVAAADDQSTPPEQSRELARRIPAARFVLIPGASHLANVEQPDAVTDQILAHLATPH
jgi:pimeloyl-ACP methyl ester carboxylesterase